MDPLTFFIGLGCGVPVGILVVIAWATVVVNSRRKQQQRRDDLPGDEWKPRDWKPNYGDDE